MYLFEIQIMLRKFFHHHPPVRQVFQVKPPTSNVRLSDVQDALCATAKLSIPNKIEYFEAHGMDFVRVFQYYDFVCRLEEACPLQMPREPWVRMPSGELFDVVRSYLAYVYYVHAFMFEVLLDRRI